MWISDSNLTLELLTTIEYPGKNSSNITDFKVSVFPDIAYHNASPYLPILLKVSDNGNCGTGTTSPCSVVWLFVLPEVPPSLFGSTAAFNHQFIGEYSFNVLLFTFSLELFCNQMEFSPFPSGQQQVEIYWKQT